MQRFRFRAQAALDLRVREHDAARRAQARAEVDLRAARHALEAATSAVDRAKTEATEAMRQPGYASQLSWYQSWIVRLEHERGACAAVVDAREKDVARALAETLRTKQRVESLEQFREKARRAWEHAALAEEQKQTDTLATLRFVSARRATRS